MRRAAVGLVPLLLLLPALRPVPTGATGACTVTGTEGDDVLEAGPAGDVVCGLGGDDLLVSGPGADVLIGGPGADTVGFPAGVAGVEVDLGAETAAGHGDDAVRTVEHVRGTSGDDTLAGNGRRNDLWGRGGDDVLDGRAGADRLSGGPGTDVVTFADAPAPVEADLGRHRARGWGRDRLLGVEDLTGTRGSDLLYGNGAPNHLEGGRGTDTLEGRGGRDLLDGGPAPDTLIGGRGRDRLLGGLGRDACLQGERRPRKRSCEVLPLAGAAGVVLFEPAPPAGVTFHESLFGSAAGLRPYGRLRRSDNPKFRRVPRTDGRPYWVMYSRGRPTGATTASDFVVARGAPIRSPVNGTVTRVRSYRLYCRLPDRLLYIRPDGMSRIRVAIFHFGRIRVRAGDRVIAGRTLLGRAHTPGGFAQEDLYVPGPHPHVHLEIERGGAQPVPGCL